jgi:hypothetical protein
MKGTFYEHLELEQFPFDSQDLTLVVYTRKFRGNAFIMRATSLPNPWVAVCRSSPQISTA